MRDLIARGEIDVSKAADMVFANAPREDVVHVLAFEATRPPRSALTGTLGKRARRHWDSLNEKFEKLKRKLKNNGRSKTAPLSSIDWATIESTYQEASYTEVAQEVTKEQLLSIRTELQATT